MIDRVKNVNCCTEENVKPTMQQAGGGGIEELPHVRLWLFNHNPSLRALYTDINDIARQAPQVYCSPFKSRGTNR